MAEYESLYISLPSSAKQQRETTKGLHRSVFVIDRTKCYSTTNCVGSGHFTHCSVNLGQQDLGN